MRRAHKREGLRRMVFGPRPSGTHGLIPRRNREGIMRTFPMRLLLSAVIVAAFAVTSVGANAGSSTASKVGPLKLCTYSTGDVNEGSQVLIVKVVAVGGRGVRGTVRFVAASK